MSQSENWVEQLNFEGRVTWGGSVEAKSKFTSDVLPIGQASGDQAGDRGTNMKATFAGKSRASVLMCLAGLLLLVGPKARAGEPTDEADPPARVARISYLDGNVSF